MRFLSAASIRQFAPDNFLGRAHFPWCDLPGFLTPEAFAALNESFPPLAAFEHHVGLKRSHGQRPHDRFYLAYEASIYHRKGKGDYALEGDAGTVGHEDLPRVWQEFLSELKNDDAYQTMIRQVLGSEPLTMRFAWHIGSTGSEVSPHRDARDKVGTHIFYFNTADDWQPAWGGSILALGGKRVPNMNPEFEDFDAEHAIDIRDNRSFLFKNTEQAWHGVRALTCPPGSYRRLFNVIFETPQAPRASLGERLKRKLFGAAAA